MVHTDYLKIQAGKQQDSCTSIFQPVTFCCFPLSSVFPSSRFFALGIDVIHMCFVFQTVTCWELGLLCGDLRRCGSRKWGWAWGDSAVGPELMLHGCGGPSRILVFGRSGQGIPGASWPARQVVPVTCGFR